MKEIGFFVSMPANYHMPMYERLVQQGWSVSVYYYSCCNSQQVEIPGVNFIPVPISEDYVYNSRLPDYAVSIGEVFNVFKAPKLIVIHGWSSPYWIFLIVLSILTRKKFLFLNDLNTLALSDDVSSPIKRIAKKAFLGLVYRFSSGAICTSKENELFSQEFIGADGIFRISWHGLYLKQFSLNNIEKPLSTQQNLNNVFIGRYEKHKGLEKIFSFLGDNKNCIFKFYGSGSYTLPKMKNLENCGSYKASDLGDIIQVGDVCVFPSDYEPLGLAFLEAAYLGAIIVVSDKVVASREVFKGGDIGCIRFRTQLQFNNAIIQINRIPRERRISIGRENTLAVKNWLLHRGELTDEEIGRLEKFAS